MTLPAPRATAVKTHPPENKFLTGFGKFVSVMILVIAGSVSQGVVTSVLWRWFVVRQFHITPISSAEAIGIVLLIRLITLGAIDSSDIDSKAPATFGEKFWIAVGKYIAVPFLLMGFGWIVLHFVH